MLINLSNHPFTGWQEAQQDAAIAVYGQVTDLQFPAVDPEANEKEVAALAKEYASKCKALAGDTDMGVHVMGEMTFIYAFVRLMQQQGVPCIASTSERLVTVLPDGDQKVSFKFARFRGYPIL